MEGLYFKYSTLQTQLHGQKVYKIPVNYARTCPNRDGTKGTGGCIFCSEKGASHEAYDSSVSITEQIKNNIAYIGPRYGAEKFDVYFQSYTNTYMPLDIFKGMIATAAEVSCDVVGMSISTRPDCIEREYLDYLKEISLEKNLTITIELGLQSVNEETLAIINRGHGLKEYIDAVRLIKEYGFYVCTHLISTLPWDSKDDLINAAETINGLCGYGDSVKIHTLYVEKDTVLADMYLKNEFEMPSMEEYFIRTSLFLAHLKPDIAISRLTGRISSETSLFENWGRSHRFVEEELKRYMRENGLYQGKYCKETNGGA